MTYATYMGPRDYARLLDRLADAHWSIDPVNEIILALAEIAGLFPASIASDPDAEPACPCCAKKSAADPRLPTPRPL